jgi:tagatose 1,6-diphosphate aldolase
MPALNYQSLNLTIIKPDRKSASNFMPTNRKLDQKTGKLRRLARLADERGCFSMLAIDQRKSLRQMISDKTGEKPADIADEGLIKVKRIVTSNLSPMASAILTDPLFGYASTFRHIPGSIGVMLSIEVTGYNIVNGNERHTRLIPAWGVEQTALAGGDAVKLLIWYSREASKETLEHQFGIVRNTGEACEKHGIPFILEVVNYPLDGKVPKSAAYAREKAERVIDAARVFSAPQYHVDMLKLEFPGELSFVKEYQDRPFSAGEVVYDLDDIQEYCRRTNEASAVPWVILSAGVEPEEFIENIKISNKAGASGFLCGRAVWKNIINSYPDEKSMEAFIRDVATGYFQAILDANTAALPWFEHNYYRDAHTAISP